MAQKFRLRFEDGRGVCVVATKRAAIKAAREGFALTVEDAETDAVLWRSSAPKDVSEDDKEEGPDDVRGAE